jgi:predicted component of type VI protein secretion system
MESNESMTRNDNNVMNASNVSKLSSHIKYDSFEDNEQKTQFILKVEFIEDFESVSIVSKVDILVAERNALVSEAINNVKQSLSVTRQLLQLVPDDQPIDAPFNDQTFETLRARMRAIESDFL